MAVKRAPIPVVRVDGPLRTTVVVGGVAAAGVLAMLGAATVAGSQMNVSGGLGPGSMVIALGALLLAAVGMWHRVEWGVLAWLGSMIVTPVMPAGPPLDLLVLLMLGGVLFLQWTAGQRTLPAIGLVEYLMLAFVALSVGSMLATHALPALQEGGEPASVARLLLTGTVLPFLAYPLGRHLLSTPRWIARVLWCLAGLGTYLAATNLVWAVGLEQLVFPQIILDETVGSNADRGRGIFLNPAATGMALVACFAATMHLATLGRGWRRAALLLAALAMLVAVALTQTRSAWVAAGLALIFLALAHRGARHLYVVVLIAIGAVVLANWSTFASSDRTQGGVTSTSETHDRLNAATTAVWGIGQEPVFGWGIGRFTALNTEHHKAYGTTPWERGYGIHPHDTQLAVGAELGLVGLAIWLGILAALVLMGRRARRTLPRAGLVSRNLVGVFWVVALSWLVTASLIDARLFTFVGALLFLMAGIMAGVGDRAQMPQAPAGISRR